MNKYLIPILIIICFVFYFLWSYERDKKQNIIFENTPLPQGVHAQVVSQPDKTIVKVSSGSGTVTQILPNYPESAVIVNITDDDSYEIKQKVLGFCFRPALALGYAENLNIGISSRFVFYRDFGLITGLGYDIIAKDLNAIAGIDYRLRVLTIPNLSLFLGYNSKSKVIVGLNFYLK